MTEAKNRKSASWAWIIGGLVAAALAVGGWWQFSRDFAPVVAVETATLGPVARVLAVNGKVEARASVQVRSAVSATVLEILVEEGEQVARGDVLAQLDASGQAAIVQQARSALEQGRINQALAAANYGRDRDLGGNIARSKLDDAKLALDGAAQEVVRLQALLDQATIQMDRYTIAAPMHGTVMSRAVDPGQLVDLTTTLFTVADLSDLIVQADVDESYASHIAKGQTALLRLVGSSETLAGSVVFVAPSVDTATGGLAIKIGFDVPLQSPVGLTVTANILVDERDAVTVPRSALAEGAVFLVKGGRAVRTPVTVIDWPAARLIVTNGLVVGDQVISQNTGLTDGLAVIVAAP